MIIVRIENFTYVSCKVFLLNSQAVVTLIK